MKIIRCSNGHFYDAEGYAECPFCKEKGSDIPARFAALGAVRKTGQGSSGAVYQISGEKTYALKEIKCGKDIEKYKNALYEIAVMQALSGIRQAVQLYDCEEKAEEENKTVYLLEEYLTPFSEFLSRPSVTVSHVIEMMIELCDGLIACRQAGIAHLDVQPKNLFVDENGKIKIGDFSSSLFLSDLQSNRHMRGTLAYMAPEVYRKGLCSEQSDIYSAGILLYCLFHEKRLPFMESGNEETAIYKRLAGTPLPEEVSRSEWFLPKLQQVIEGACAYEVTERFGTFEEYREQLRLLLADAQSSSAGNLNMYPAKPVMIAPAPMVPLPGSMDDFDTCAPGSMDDFGTSIPGGMDAFDTCSSGEMKTALAPGAPAPQMSMAAPFGAPSDMGESVNLKKVQFSAVVPKTFIKGDYTMVEIVMYEESFRKIVDELIAGAEEPVKETKSGMFKVADGTTVRICLSSPDIEIDDNEEEQEWQGEYLNFSFAVMLPDEYKKRQILFTASVFFNDVIATRLKFIVKCSSLFEQKVKVDREDILSAFISYASQDRQKVAAIIQGMKKARPEMDIFFDVESLRSGENWEKALYHEIEKRDILFLFWSQFSRESKWVDAEWRYAMANKGIECIEPVPIDPPSVCPPPAELVQKHFNDKLLYIINEKGADS